MCMCVSICKFVCLKVCGFKMSSICFRLICEMAKSINNFKIAKVQISSRKCPKVGMAAAKGRKTFKKQINITLQIDLLLKSI